MDKKSLNVMYSEYSQGLLERKQFENLLCESVLDYLINFNHYRWKKDECLDYLSWFYPRLSKAIDNYKNSGATFETYIGTLIRWSAKEYHSRHENKSTAERIVWMVKLPDMYVHEEEPDYFCGDQIDFQSEQDDKPVRNPRQLLLLILILTYPKNQTL